MIVRKQRKNGSIFYQNTITGKITSKKEFFNQENFETIFEPEKLNLTTKEKRSFAASKRLRVNGAFISKGEERTIKAIFQEKGIQLKGNEITNILPLEEVKDIFQKRKETKETILAYSKGYDKKTKKRTVIFDIFEEINASKKAGRKFKITENGETENISFTQLISRVTNFINKESAGYKNPPLFIWALTFEQDGDILNVNLDETQVIPSE